MPLSDTCYQQEMAQALSRQRAGLAQVIPVTVSACDWKDSAFAELQVLPSDEKPVTSWSNRDEAWTNVVQGIWEAIVALAGH